MKVRIVSKGWETYTGQIGPGAIFVDGVSTEDLHPRVIARIGSSVILEEAETGKQVGPAVIAQMMQDVPIENAPANIYKKDVDAAAKVEAEAKAEADAAQAAAEAEALAAAEKEAAEKKVDEEADIVYTREELEAIGSNDGIAGLREIAEVHGVKGRAIGELVEEILKAQDEKLAE